MSPSKTGYLLILASAVMWSFGGILVKTLTQTYGVDPRAVACLRSTVAGLVLSWALPRLKHAPRWRVVGAGISYTLVVFGFVVSTSGTTAANAIFLQYAYPLFVAVGAVLIFSEPLGRRTLLALVIGMSGIATILICSWTPGQREGVAYGFMSAFAFAAFTLLQRSMRDGHPIAMSSFHNLMAAALILPFAWGRFQISFPALLIVAVMGTFQLGIPYVLFIWGLKTVPTTDAALLTLVEPVLNPVWVWLFIGETPHPSTIVGGALILLALLTRFLGVRRVRQVKEMPKEPDAEEKCHDGESPVHQQP
ncbi:MAG: DMT family transporter [Planctomycetes bacterium]|nr:DMT family transporter [Planctomycetota bacterium]